jgi:hypothetical protein
LVATRINGFFEYKTLFLRDYNETNLLTKVERRYFFVQNKMNGFILWARYRFVNAKRVFAMITYDFNAHSLNGEAVPFCALPFHALENVFSHKELTHAAKNTYVALLAYAAYVKKLDFNITVGWVAEKISVTRKTASAALSQLRELGFANDNGIIIPDTTKRAKKTNKLAKNPKTLPAPEIENLSPQFVHDDTPVLPSETQANFPNQQTVANDYSNDTLEAQLSYEEEVEVLVKTGFAREKAEKIINNSKKKLPVSEEKITKSVDTFYPPINNTENLTDKDNLTTALPATTDKDQFAAANQVGCQFSSFVEVKEVRANVSNSMASIKKIYQQIKSLTKQKEIANNRAYAMKALTNMNVTSPGERERYFAELIYALEMGFIRSLRAGLWLIAQGRWKTPIGFSEHYKVA